jgi:hypothetical protein
MNTNLNETTHRISLEKAIQMTTLYRQQKENILKSEYAGTEILPISETFGRQAFDDLLAQPGCISVRIYYSMDEALKLHSIIVGVNDQNKDILPIHGTEAITENTHLTESAEEEETEGVIIEEAQRCPPLCEPTPPLNP